MFRLLEMEMLPNEEMVKGVLKENAAGWNKNG
jgi:hypothetical protein